MGGNVAVEVGDACGGLEGNLKAGQRGHLLEAAVCAKECKPVVGEVATQETYECQVAVKHCVKRRGRGLGVRGEL